MTDLFWPGERAMLASAREGAVWVPAMQSDDTGRIRGEVLASFATGGFDVSKLGPLGLEMAGGEFPDRPLPIALRGAKSYLEIIGAVDFFEQVLPHDFIIDGAHFDSAVAFRFAKTRRIHVRGSHFVTGFDAQGLKATGDVDLGESVTERQIRLAHAEIWGNLTLDGLKDLLAQNGRRNDDGEEAETIDARNLQLKGNLILSEADLAGSLILSGARIERSVTMRQLHTQSYVSLYGTTIGGSLYASGASIKGKSEFGAALLASDLNVSGDVLIDMEFTAESGSVSFYGATIGGHLSASGAILKGQDANRYALNATGAEIGGVVLIRDGFKTESGGVSFYGSTIGGHLEAGGAILKGQNAKGYALTAEGAKIGGAVLIRNGFATNSGDVRFFGATVVGDFEAQGADFQSGEPDHEKIEEGGFLNLYGVTIEGRLFLCNFKNPPKGGVILADAKANSITFGSPGSDKTGLWSNSCGLLEFNGFQFDSLTNTTSKASDWSKLLQRQKFPARGRRRIDVLRFIGSKGFLPQPWTQAAKVLQRAGHEGEARKLRVERDKCLYRDEPFGDWTSRAWGLIQHWIIGYGHAPHRVAVWFALAISLGGLIAFPKAEEAGGIVPAQEEVLLDETYRETGITPDGYPQFNPLIYSVDAFLPVLDLRQVTYWRMRGPYQTYYILHTVFGWLVVSLGVLALAGFIGRE